MKHRIVAILLAVSMLASMLSATVALGEEELELIFSPNELVQDKSDDESNSVLDSVTDQNAAIMEALGQKDWNALADAVKLTGDWRDDLVNVAASQVGYAEDSDGMTIYTTWSGKEKAVDWTALFINWVAEKAELSSREFPRGESYDALRSAMNKVKAVKKISRSAYPTAGDLAFIERNGQKLVGIVTYVSDGYASMIVGDNNGRVSKETWAVGTNEFNYYADLNVLMERAGIEVGKGGEVPYIPEDGVAAWTNTNAVYMRSEPTTASSRVTMVKKSGTALMVYSGEMQDDGYIWYAVKYGKYSGYIRGDLLSLDMAAIQASMPTAVPAPTATPAPIVVPGCVLCANEAGNTALPVECCYEHLKALGSEYANQFMAALMEVDATTWELYVKCHAIHVENGAEAIIPLGGLTVQERVVNIDVKKALVGEAVTISFEIYGASNYEWHEVKNDVDAEGALTEIDTVMVGETDAELTVYAKPGETVSYYCVATLPLGGGNSVQMTSKRTTLSTDAPIVAVAILGEEVNFTYEYVGAASYRWYKLDSTATVAESVMSADTAAANTARFTTYATAENNGAYYYCEALDANGYLISTSSYFMYQIDTADLCKYVDELVGMTRTERYEIMTKVVSTDGTNTWAEYQVDENTTLADAVMTHWQADHKDDYSKLLCTCGMNAANATHDRNCGWYVAPVDSSDSDDPIVIELSVPYGIPQVEECAIIDGDRYDLYLDNVLVHSGDKLLTFEGTDTERIYHCYVFYNDGREPEEIVYRVTSSVIPSMQWYLNSIAYKYATFNDATQKYEFDEEGIYKLMTQTLAGKTVVVRDMMTGDESTVDIVQGVFQQWKTDNSSSDAGMFCTCCITYNENTGAVVVSDKIMLHPDALHKDGCPWDKPLASVPSTGTANVTLEGVFPAGMVLSANTATPDQDVFAKMRDAGEYSLVSLKAFDITPMFNGETWQPAKGTTVKVNIPNVYDPSSVRNPVVNVYHLLVDEADIAPGYGYEKLSSEHYNGVTVNGDGSIAFETDGFSTFYVEVTEWYDMCHLCDGTGCMYSMIIDVADVAARFSVLESQNGSLAVFLDNYYRHVDAGAFDLLCSSMNREMTKDQLSFFNPSDGTHALYCLDENCPWNQNVTYHTGANQLVGDTVTLNGGSANSVWYRNNVEYATGASIEVEAPAQQVVYTCKNGDTVVSTHVVVAQTSVLNYYVARIANNYYDWNTYTYDRKAVYTLMTGKWNVTANANQRVEPVNLAQSILAYWYETCLMTEIDDMFCSCCFTTDGEGTYTFDGIMRHPDDLHEEGCKWGGDHNVSVTPAVSTPDALKDLVFGETITLTTSLDGTSFSWQAGTMDAEGKMTWTDITGANTDTVTITLTGEVLTTAYRCVVTDGSGNKVESTVAYIGGVEFHTWASTATEEENVADWLTNLRVEITLQHIVEAYEKHQQGIPLSEVILMIDGKLYSLMDFVLLAELDENNQLIDVRYHIAVATYDPDTGAITALN